MPRACDNANGRGRMAIFGLRKLEATYRDSAGMANRENERTALGIGKMFLGYSSMSAIPGLLLAKAQGAPGNDGFFSYSSTIERRRLARQQLTEMRRREKFGGFGVKARGVLHRHPARFLPLLPCAYTFEELDSMEKREAT